MGRRYLASGLVVAASVLGVLALVAGYAARAFLDSDQFANRATAALRDDAVSSLVARRITDDLVLANAADLIAARPLIESVAAEAVGGGAFTGLFRKAVRDVHAAVFDRDQDTFTLAVADVGTVVAAAVQKLRPEVARQVRADEKVELVTSQGSVGTRLAQLADRVRHLALLLLLLTVAAVAGALRLASDRRRAVVRLGIGAAAGGVVLAVTYAVLRGVVVGGVEGAEEQAAAGAVWDAFLSDMRTASLILAVSGAVVAASAASLIRPRPLGEPLRRMAEWLGTEPERPRLRALRGAGLVVAGVVVIAERDAVIALTVTLLGVYLVYEGTTALLTLVYRAPVAAEEPRPRRDRRRIAATAIPAAIVVAVVAAFVGGGGTTTAAPPGAACNGHRELCARTLPEVALAATHNSMSVPLRGWYSSMQDASISDQLRDGIRALLIDTHYADKLPNGKLRTVIQSGKEDEEDAASAEAEAAALRIRERLGFKGEGERGMYLCHSFCELGGTELSSVLDDLHDFLVANPGEVVVVINQDYVTPEDFVGAVRDADLEELVYAAPAAPAAPVAPVDGAWPTLRQMVDSGRRLVLLAENEAGGAPWYHPVYDELTEETPYSFGTVEQLIGAAGLAASCKANRGPEGAPLFLVNHWTTTDPAPLPSHADQVNAAEPMLRRIRECERVRGHLPNLVAVNFYRRGDLFRVVDELNRVG